MDDEYQQKKLQDNSLSFEPNQLREKKAEDVQKHRRIHREWAPASESTSGTLEQILKEPELLLFFRGAI
jgi:hypothetical protein